jgi:asparagine synthase (glutamine-hydrolysing)
MAEQSSRPIKTFSIRFEEKSHDEAESIHLMVDRLKTDHQEWTLRPEVIPDLSALAQQYEEPYADPAALPTYLMSKEVSKEVKVALNGDGGDENFAGYRAYQAYAFDQKVLHHFPSILQKSAQLFFGGLAYLPLGTARADFFAKMEQFLMNANHTPEERFLQYVCFFTEPQKESLITEAFRAEQKSGPTRSLLAQQFHSALAHDSLDQAMWVDIHTHLVDNLLPKVDLGTMAHGLESRSPFLDPVFMQKMAMMPSHLKLKHRTSKYLLKKAFADKVPDEILYRPKQGFDLPLEHWFRHELKAYAHDLLLSQKSVQRGLFKKEALEQFLKSHAEGKSNHGRQLWALMMLELWYRAYVDAQPQG